MSWVAPSPSPKRASRPEAARARVDLGQPRLELARHLVERRAELRELVAPADGDALASRPRAIARAAPRRAPEGAHDGAPLGKAAIETADERRSPSSRRLRELEFAASISDCGLETAKRTLGEIGDCGSDERAEALIADRDRPRLARADVQRSRATIVGDDATSALAAQQDEIVGRPET